MAKHLKYLIVNENARKEMGKRARDYAIENYTFEKIGKRYLEIFKNLTKGWELDGISNQRVQVR